MIKRYEMISAAKLSIYSDLSNELKMIIITRIARYEFIEFL